jgi:hypothetical protein
MFKATPYLHVLVLLAVLGASAGCGLYDDGSDLELAQNDDDADFDYTYTEEEARVALGYVLTAISEAIEKANTEPSGRRSRAARILVNKWRADQSLAALATAGSGAGLAEGSYGEDFAWTVNSLTAVKLNAENVPNLIEVLNDDEATLVEQQGAYAALSAIGSRDCLEPLLALYPDLKLTAHTNPGLLVKAVEGLDTEIVAPHAEAINRVVEEVLTREPQNPGALRIAVVMAFKHDDATAQGMLDSHQGDEETTAALLEALYWLSWDPNKTYVEQIQAAHESPKIKDLAGRMLAAW